MLVSGVQQNESVTHIHISTLFKILFPYRPLRFFKNSLASSSNHLKGLSILFYPAFLGVSKQGRGVPLQPHFQKWISVIF